MINNSLGFWPNYYTYIRIIFSIILSQPRLSIEILVIKIEKNITFRKMIKKDSKKDIINFLQMPNKLSSNKKR